ncbi:hypothetical protein GCM10007160_15940 [Litchfieldella qijiaojingensis]|uniref:Aminotransferase n=1 Tax=Litchfieldella qijiaojingensis TaxID=980347 RepID=A0ABQ2YP87_9GAMM|nr:hypothetical protein [Halomonas qijiaojingensis]GGX89386.1 hypothetical protein GCM10007160_15940 [Halomonas qijiaojingensis]
MPASRLAPIPSIIASEALAMGCTVIPADHRVGHMLGVRLPGGSIPETLSKRLEEEQVFVSVRGDALRIAPHVYNDTSDAERLLTVLREFV